MKVTDTIKKYIAREVKERMLFPLKRKYLDLVQKRDDFKDKAQADIRQKVAELPYKSSRGYQRFLNIDTFFLETPYDEEALEMNKELSKRGEEVDKTIERIIAILELGGNKNDLDKMLNELGNV